MAIAVEKIGLHKVIAHKLLGVFPSTARGIIFASSYYICIFEFTLIKYYNSAFT